MKFSCKWVFLSATALSGISALPAVAQQSASPEALEIITVTAQRREQLLKDVPISISAFSAETIAKANITEAKNYLALSPNVSFTEDGGIGNRSINIAIRGVSDVSRGLGTSQIGYYVDELSVGVTAKGTYNPQLLDVERIEVLRGPQGTYFGRGAAGGALNITTKRPTDDFYAEAGAEASRFDTYKGYGIVNVPLTQGLSFRGVGSYETSNGLVRNVNPKGTPNSGYDYVYLRGALRAVLSDRLTADLSVAYTDEDEGMDATVASGVLDLDTRGTFGSGFKAINEQLGFYPENKRFVNHNSPEFNRNSSILINNRLNWEGDGFSIRSITGYLGSKNARQFDQDNISVDALTRNNNNKGDSFSQELRIQSEGKGAFEWVIGGLYAHDKISQFSSIKVGSLTTYTDPVTGKVTALLPPAWGPGFLVNQGDGVYKAESLAGFADLTWHVMPRLTLTAGARFSHDTIHMSAFNTIASNKPLASSAGSASFNDFSPRFVARYDVTDEANIYASVSSGYRPGGVDINTAVISPFSPEKLWSYEAGFKGSALNNAVQYSASFFYLKWSDLQVKSRYYRDPNDISSNVTLTLNAAEATNKGFEFEVQTRLSESLRASAGFGFLDSKFDSFPDAVLPGKRNVDMSGRRVPKTPRYTFSAALDYDHNISGNWDFFSRAELNYRSSAPGDLEGAAAVALGLPNFPYIPKAYTVVNLRAGINNNRYELGAYVENLFKEDYYTGTADGFGLAGIRLRPHPRIWGVTAKFKFGN
ncbi:TonB-dependent receptor [Govanella unica]|uniref:TonB-dependent receptor n=1 Tax=Govanella unica TaxID=2975056 RepID=A0A9X3Z8A0_9PROT|nr:TonB-dependent receptor [Govania unica]MDA5195017.1 TonB-dependent receptor [Govania unica]